MTEIYNFFNSNVNYVFVTCISNAPLDFEGSDQTEPVDPKYTQLFEQKNTEI